MAGIAGIIKRNKHFPFECSKSAIRNMISSMKYSGQQLDSAHVFENAHFGNVIPISQAVNNHAVSFKEQGIHAVIDGLVFINAEDKRLVAKNYSVGKLNSENEYLPYLFQLHGEKIVHRLTGWYNIFIYDEKAASALLFNDRLGYLPCYYHEQANVFAFASKIESLLASGILPEVRFDLTSFAEHLFFNYTLSDYTYIRGIKTLPDATLIRFTPDGITKERYWQVEAYFDLPPLNKKDSIEAINQGLKDAVGKVMSAAGSNAVNFSLTGGWDSRVVLSYLIPEYRQMLNAYSFGAPLADDITVPQLIAEKEGFKYTPYLLDQDYLDNHFLKSAADTILLSNGTRNYKRSHYLYAIKQIAAKSNLLITGIFGDEVFKVGRPQGGSVISKNAVDFIGSGFDVAEILDRLKESGITELLNTPSKGLHDEFVHRMVEVGQRFKVHPYSGQQYFAFRFCLNLRKYFGNEVNSYNDFVWCHSPFIDHDFMKVFAETRHMVSRFPFETPSVKLKAQSSWLYYEITKRNHTNLTKYPSSRGFSMHDTNTLSGLPKILWKKLFKGSSSPNLDEFNTKKTDLIFRQFVNQLIERNQFELSDTLSGKDNPINLEYYALQYWKAIISNKYNK
jgi:asparagine synthetase B (glutamine-hydrolysing)